MRKQLDPIKCAVCSKEFIPARKERVTCSRSCGGKLGNTKEARAKGKKTKLERYGDENYNNRDKYRKNLQDTYGEEITNHSQLSEVKEKIVKTYSERHGGMGMASKSVNKKVLDKVKSNYNINDGSITNVGQVDEIKEKIASTHEARWGGMGFASEELSERAKSTYKERYGEDLYNSEYRSSLIIQSFIDKYGVHSPAMVPEFKEKLVSNYIKKNGGMGNARDLAKEEFNSNVNKFKELYLSGETIYEIADLMNVTLGTIYSWARELNIVITAPNKLNETWQHLIKKETGITFKYEGLIYGDRRRADLYNSELKLAIEINPTITHTTQPSVFFGKSIPVKYHQERAMAAEENGWKLIQIFDWDSPDDIITLIKNIAGVEQETIYARKCKLEEITLAVARDFLRENHRQGSLSKDKIAYGLYYDDRLVQVMTFSKERFVKSGEDDYELLRMATLKNVRVIGGASKLFKAFINSEYQPQRVKSFVDYSKGNGKAYEHMGMQYVGLANLNAYYANIDTGEALKVTAVTSRFKKEYDKLDITQQEFMNSKRFFRINDAGNKIFEWVRA